MPRRKLPKSEDVEMENVSVEPLSPDAHIIISLDFGTVKSKAAFTTIDAAIAADQLKRGVFDLHLVSDVGFDNEPTRLSIMAFHEGYWSFGARVNSLISAGSMPASKKISLIKLGLAEGANTEQMNSKLDRQIEDLPDDIGVKTRQDLVAVFLFDLNRKSN